MPTGGNIVPIDRGMIARAVGSVRHFIDGVNQAWFGPSQPLPPMAPPEVKGRQFDYPYGTNLQYTPRGDAEISFGELRALADSLPLLRLAIETRKDQVQAIKWNIRPKNPTTDKNDPRIAKLTEFLEFPDREHDFSTWLRMLLEEMLVIDAASIYPRLTRGGDMFSWDLIDGATVKRLVDESGRSPLPPSPAYQQVLHGIPAADFSLEELVYAPRNPRVNRFYGFSPVEQIILTVNIALRRDLSTLEYYKSGSLPDSVVALPKEWTIEQVGGFQKYWDSLLSGNLANRRMTRFVPGGQDFKLQETKQPPLKDNYDEWLARIICYALSVTVSPLVAQVNRASGETMKVTATEEGLSPTLVWSSNVINRIISHYMKIPDLEFSWMQEATDDPLKRAQADEIDLRTGTQTLDQVRAARGFEPYGVNGITNKPLIYTATGPVPLEESVQKALDNIENPPPPLPFLFGKKPPEEAPEKTEEPKEEVGKVATAPFGRLRKASSGMSYDTPTTRDARRKLTKVVAAGLLEVKESVIDQVKLMLSKAEETPKKKARRIANDVDLSGLRVVVDGASEQLDRVARASGISTLAQLGVGEESLFDQVNVLAAHYAKGRAAQMVGMRYNEDGELVPAARAEYRIDDTTRDMIRDTIASGLEDNIGVDGIIDELMESYAFSEERAEAIARSELTRANNEGAIEAARTVNEETGMKLKKGWLATETACEICSENEDEGFIDLDDAFPSGDDCAPAHPNCECTTIFEAEEGE